MRASRPSASPAWTSVRETRKVAMRARRAGNVAVVMGWPDGKPRPTASVPLEVESHHELGARLMGERLEVGGQPGEVPSDDRIIPPTDVGADAKTSKPLLVGAVQSHGPIGIEGGADGRELPGARQ